MAITFQQVGFSSATDEWPTPPKIVAALAKEFGPFTLDPAADDLNAKAANYFTRENDGLSQPWYGRVWLNPPYGRTVGQWLKKARQEVEQRRAELVVCLVPARVDSHWWKANVEDVRPKPLVRFWLRRIQFVEKQDAPFSSAIIVYGKLTGRHGKTAKLCAHCKELFWPAYNNRRTCSEACQVSVIRARRKSAIRTSITDTNISPIADTQRFTCDVVFRVDWEIYDLLVAIAK